MSTFKTQAIVLSKHQLAEADCWYVLYSEAFGKIEAQVKSALSSSSKLAGSLEPVAKVAVMIVNGRLRETIAGVQLIKRYQLNDWPLLAQVGLIRELFLKLVKLGVAEPRLYKNLDSYLSALAAATVNLLTSRFLTQRFIWQMLNILGHGGTESTEFLIKNLPQTQGQLSSQTVALLNACLKAKGTPAGLQVSGRPLQSLESFTKNYLTHLLEKNLLSFNF